MPSTQPDLSVILQNEMTLNSNLSVAQVRLRSILDKEEIGYTSGDGVIPLIRKLPVPQLGSINIYFENMEGGHSSDLSKYIFRGTDFDIDDIYRGI